MMSDFRGEGVKNRRKSSDIIYVRSLRKRNEMICWAYTISNPDLTNQIFLNQFFCCHVSNLIKISDCVSDNLFFSLNLNGTKAFRESHLNCFTLHTISICTYFLYVGMNNHKNLLILKRNKDPNATSKSFWTHCIWVEYKQSCIFKPKHSWIRTSSQIRTSWIEQLCCVNNESA